MIPLGTSVAVSSEEPGKDRWTELELYRQQDGELEVVVVGESRLPGEWRREKSIICADEAEVVEALRAPDSGHLSGLALKLCTAAQINVEQEEASADHSRGGRRRR